MDSCVAHIVNQALDISMAHPWSKYTISHAARENGYVARKREMKRLTNIATNSYQALLAQTSFLSCMSILGIGARQQSSA